MCNDTVTVKNWYDRRLVVMGAAWQYTVSYTQPAVWSWDEDASRGMMGVGTALESRFDGCMMHDHLPAAVLQL